MAPTLSLCGIPVTLAAPLGVDWRLAEASGVRAVLQISVREDDVLATAAGRLLYDGPQFSVWEEGERLVIDLRDDDGRALALAAWWRSEGRVEISCRREGAVARRQLLDEVLPELLVVHIGPTLGRAYLHASGTLADTGARLFLGTSGQGKSTAAQIMVRERSERLFTADRCAAWIDEQPWTASAPWHGGARAANHREPLAALFVLERGGAPGVQPLAGAKALAALAANSFLPRWWPRGLDAALENLERLVARVPTFALCSEPDVRLAARVDAVVEVRP
jgi:hypothetical protein